MKIILALCCVLCIVTKSQSQQLFTTQYYDSSWMKSDSDASYYYCTFKVFDNLFLKECYWRSSGKMASIAMLDGVTPRAKTIGKSLTYFPDSKVKKETNYDDQGIQISSYSYYENGMIEDSMFYNEENNVDSGFHYFDNGKTRAVFYAKNGNVPESFVLYNTNGELVNNGVYMKEADFGKSKLEWRNFVAKHIDPGVPLDRGARTGSYEVVMRFIVEPDGKISNLQSETNHGYGMEEQVIKMLLKSPKWNPAIFLGEPVRAYRRQPVTFMIP